MVWAFTGSLATRVTAEGVIIRRGGGGERGGLRVRPCGRSRCEDGRRRAGESGDRRKSRSPVLLERIKVTEEALADARRERERALKVRTDSAHLQLDALARQRSNAEAEIKTCASRSKLSTNRFRWMNSYFREA